MGPIFRSLCPLCEQGSLEGSSRPLTVSLVPALAYGILNKQGSLYFGIALFESDRFDCAGGGAAEDSKKKHYLTDMKQTSLGGGSSFIDLHSQGIADTSGYMNNEQRGGRSPSFDLPSRRILDASIDVTNIWRDGEAPFCESSPLRTYVAGSETVILSNGGPSSSETRSQKSPKLGCDLKTTTKDGPLWSEPGHS